MATPQRKLDIVVLVSGNGGNLQAIMDAIAGKELPATIRAVISNREDAYGLRRAAAAGIPVAVVNHREFPDRQAYDQALRAVIDRYHPGLVVLAGFMRILTPGFVAHYAGRMLNIHPSLLPAFTGLNTHQRALEAGVKEHGASIHFVTADLDAGPVIVQARLPVTPADTAETLASRVKLLEHQIYPLAIRWFAEGRVRLQDDQVIFDDKPLRAPLDYAQISGTVSPS